MKFCQKNVLAMRGEIFKPQCAESSFLNNSARRFTVYIAFCLSSMASYAQNATTTIATADKPIASVPNTYCSNQSYDPIYARCNVKLGLPKEEAIAQLNESHRRFLDGVLRIYSEPGLIAKRKEAITALGAEVDSTKLFTSKFSDGKEYITSRIDQFKGEGIFTPHQYWTSFYRYSVNRSVIPSRDLYYWLTEITVSIDTKRECLPSRAVEGYLDVPMGSRIFYLAQGAVPRERWDRHGPGGHHAIAERLSKTTPVLSLGIIDGCLSGIYLETNFSSKEMSDDDILN